MGLRKDCVRTGVQGFYRPQALLAGRGECRDGHSDRYSALNDFWGLRHSPPPPSYSETHDADKSRWSGCSGKSRRSRACLRSTAGSPLSRPPPQLPLSTPTHRGKRAPDLLKRGRHTRTPLRDVEGHRLRVGEPSLPNPLHGGRCDRHPSVVCTCTSVLSPPTCSYWCESPL